RATRPPRPLDHPRRPRKPDAALHLDRDGAFRDCVDVATVVNEPEIGPRDRIGDVKIVGRHDGLGDEPFAQQPVLRHREAMMFWQRQREGVGIKGFHVHYSCSRMLALKTIDAHAAGEPLRLVVDGFPSPRGATMLEKREWLKKR